jgi:hypothetical protein
VTALVEIMRYKSSGAKKAFYFGTDGEGPDHGLTFPKEEEKEEGAFY